MVSNLHECIVYSAHGASAARIEAMIYGAGLPIADPAVRLCQYTIGESLRSLAADTMKARHLCGRKILLHPEIPSNQACDPAKLDAAIYSSIAKTRSVITSSCSPTVIPQLTFGGSCAGSFGTVDEAATCLINNVVTEGWVISDVVYRTPL
jgi:hypothetical protein